MISRALRGPALLGVLAAPGPFVAAEPARWHVDSFRDWSEGTLPDAGANVYAAADGSLRLINGFDFNRDGLPDVFLPSNGSDSSVVDLSIYWDQPGYDAQHFTRLPTAGGKDAAIGDLNRDGWNDLVVVNNFDGTRNELDAFLYWGGPDGFSPERRSTLPTQGAQAVAIADLDDDGWPDLVIANSGLTYHVSLDRIQQSYLYWNDHGAFAADRRTLLPSINGRDVAVGDLDGDGRPEIVLVSAGNEPAEAGARILYARDNYGSAGSVFLPGEGSTGVALGDLDRDGRAELVLVNGHRLKGREGGIYNIVDTAHLDSFVYWNSAQGFRPERRTGLPTIGGAGVALGDLDRDGWPEVIFANAGGGASFVYWNSGDGFLPRRRLALPTRSAQAVLAADLNGDTHLDLVFANHVHDGSYDTASFIYWGGAEGPDATTRAELPTSGAGAIVVGDLRNQARQDLVFINQIDARVADQTPSSLYLSERTRPTIFDPRQRILLETGGLDAYSAADLDLDGDTDLVVPASAGVSILWAEPAGFDPGRRTAVSTQYAFSTRIADFNRDGFLDLLLSEWRPGSTSTRLHHGGPAGFSSAASTALPVGGIRFHTIGDFNRDGWIDVAFPVFNEQRVSIFWNSPAGFSAASRTDLPGRSPVALEVADLDGDGFLDLIVPNLFDQNPPAENTTRAFGGSPQGDVFLYWGSANGYSNERRTTLAATGAEDAVVADLDRDGRLDLVVTAYHAGTRRDLPSYVFWQGPAGFDDERVTRLETYSASGALVSDYNADGWPDLLFANHHRNGSHRNWSFLYWGGAEGFSADRRLDLPADGPHLLTVTDHGNIADRTHRYSYVSPAKEFPAARELRGITWRADTPAGTAVHLQVRSAATAADLETAAWAAADGAGSTFAAPAAGLSLPLDGPWVQFRVLLENPGGGLPVVRAVTLDLD